MTADDLSGDLSAASDAAVFAAHAAQLARGASEAAQVLGLQIEAVVQRTTTGLAAVAARSDVEAAAAACADAETINEPLRAEADKRLARSQDTRRTTAAAAAALQDAQEVARFRAITARIREGAPVNNRDVLWARDFSEDHPELLAPASLAPPDRGGKAGKRTKAAPRTKAGKARPRPRPRLKIR